MFETFHQWVDRKLRVNGYELRQGEIVSTGLPKRLIRLQDVRTWQGFFIGGGVPSVCIEYFDGRKIDFSDKHEQLFQILHEVAADKELPFVTA